MTELQKAAEGWLFKHDEHDNELSFTKGAEWQQEQDKGKYSEEEVIKLLIKFNQEINEVENVSEWFEQFKKK
jgi:hypothetical protein